MLHFVWQIACKVAYVCTYIYAIWDFSAKGKRVIKVASVAEMHYTFLWLWVWGIKSFNFFDRSFMNSWIAKLKFAINAPPTHLQIENFGKNSYFSRPSIESSICFTWIQLRELNHFCEFFGQSNWNIECRKSVDENTFLCNETFSNFMRVI